MNSIEQRRHSTLGGSYRLFYEQPLHFVRGEDVWLYDKSGQAYLDAYNNVPSVGHCHPRVVEALTRQAGQLNTHTRYLHETILDYAEAMLATMPTALDRIVFTCTGSEANDLALRMAEIETGNTGIIVTRNAYHGITKAVSQISPSVQSAAYRGTANMADTQATAAPHVEFIDAPDLYRTNDADTSTARFTADIKAAVDRLAARNIKPCALIVDTVFSSDGIHLGQTDCLTAAADTIHAAGGIFIADEVQGGLWRTGEQCWAFQREQFTPDIVTMGKSLGDGHPIAAVVSTRQRMDRFGQQERYFNTYGGNTVSAAVGLAVMQVLAEEHIPLNVTTTGDHARQRLAELQSKRPEIGDVRGQGLYIGVDIVSNAQKDPDPQKAAQLHNDLKTRHILIGLCGPQSNVLKIRPPLTFQKEHVDQLVDSIDNCLQSL